jgi:tetratricopeptide (TPR) repeat protein
MDEVMKRLLLLFFCILCCWNGSYAQEVDSLKAVAESYIDMNRLDEASKCFERILTLDAKDYDALAYLSNYYFLRGQKVINQAEKGYQSILNPNRMQIAQYQNERRRIYTDYFEKAEHYLIRAILLRRNDQLDQMAAYLADYKKSINIVMPMPLK